MNNDEFQKETEMCRELYRKNKGGCAWGKCKTCGVIPLLYKLHKGIFVEKEEEVKALKKEVFGDEQYL